MNGLEYILVRPHGFYIILRQEGGEAEAWRWAVASAGVEGRLIEQASAIVKGSRFVALAAADRAIGWLPSIEDTPIIQEQPKTRRKNRTLEKSHILEAVLNAFYCSRLPVSVIQVTAWQDLFDSPRTVSIVLNLLADEDGLLIRVGRRFKPSAQLLQSRRRG